MKEKYKNISFDELCEKLGNAYVKFLCALNDLESEGDDVLTAGINHPDCKNHFLSNAYLSMFDKFELSKPWIYHSTVAGKQIKAKNKNWKKDLSFEHIIPKQEYLQSVCENLVKEKGKAALEEVIELIKKYWKIAIITSEENKHLLVRKMPYELIEQEQVDKEKKNEWIFSRYNQPKDDTQKIVLYDYKENPVNQ